MDLKVIPVGLAVFVHLIFLIQPVNLKSLGRECRQCKPGYYASRLCTEFHDTVCKQCPKGTFTSKSNKVKSCSPCSVCDIGEFVSKECSVRRDTVCESCAAVKGNVNENFIRSCKQQLQGDDSSEKIRFGDPSNIKLDKEGTIGSELVNSESLTVLPEGSGTGIIEEIDDTSYPISNETEEIEGSGTVTDETVDLNATISVILPDSGDEDIATTLETSNTTTTTTTKEGVIDIGEGVILENITIDTSGSEADTVKTTTHSTAKTITVGDNGGVVIDYNPVEDTADETNDEIGGSVDVEIVANEEPQTGASHKKRDQSDGVSTGVVITVGLVAALVFFIIGFVVSRYWSRRQERTFNVQEAERRNGKPPIECSGIEYKDPENNIPGKGNIYGKVPTSKTANGNTPEVKPQHAHSDKPISRTSVPSTGSQPNKTEPNGPTVKPRAESEIRYIDEDPTDEGEREALIQQTSQNQSHSGTNTAPGSNSSPEVNTSTDSNNESVADENTPMISKTNNTS